MTAVSRLAKSVPCPAVWLALCLSAAGPVGGQGVAGNADGAACVSEAGLFHVSYTSELEPITINRIHGWILHVETAQGEPVTGAEITVGGGMPAHDHGLPTSPRQTEELGNGDYRIEGMRFHMNGRWEIEITVDANPRRDTCVFSLTL